MDKVQRHTHNGIDSEQLYINKAIIGFPLEALTADVGGSLSSDVGGGNLKTSDSVIIANMRTRINELEARLQAIEALL